MIRIRPTQIINLYRVARLKRRKDGAFLRSCHASKADPKEQPQKHAVFGRVDERVGSIRWQ